MQGVQDARDAARREIARRGLTPTAVGYLANEALGRVEFERLAPLKRLLKQFFSDASWLSEQDAEVAELVGPGEGWWRHELGGEFHLAFGWRDGEFQIELGGVDDADRPPSDAGTGVQTISQETFEGRAIPEATPNPRTIRFVTGELHAGPSRWYESATEVDDDPRVARLFSEFDDVANVLVGPDFVAVGIQRPDRWEQLLARMLTVVDAEFHARPEQEVDATAPRGEPRRATVDARATASTATSTALDLAWRELRDVKLREPDGVARVLAAAAAPDVASRQVAARLLIDADRDVAERVWSELLGDPSRSVRRATLDVMVDAARPELRPLFERALADPDAWTRWKALRGLADLGIDPSRDSVSALAADTDFRVRLEAARALRGRR